MRAISIWCLIGLAATLHAQAPLPAADPVIHVSVNLVQVDAVVTDLKGNHVTDLQPGDFEILEDRKPQKITNFSFIDVSPGATSLPTKNLRKEDVRRSIVLMIDDVGTNSQDLARIFSDMHRFVTDQVQPGDLVAVTASRGGMGFYSNFSSDKRMMHAAIDHIGRRPGWLLCDYVSLAPNGLPPDPLFCGPPNPIGYLTWAIQGLQNVPGRKAVVLFTSSFAAPPPLVELANRAGVVIYVLHPFPWPVSSYEPARQLAKQTGGLFIDSVPGKDLSEDLGRVLEDMSGYYLIGYQPDRSDFELSQGRPVHHDIQVRVRRTGLTVRARNGFMGVPDPVTSPPPKTREEYLRQALFSPFSASGIRLRLDPVYGALPPDPKTKQRLPVLRAMLATEAGDVKFADGDNGRKKLVLDVVVAVFSQDGTPVTTQDRTFTINVTRAEAEQLAASGLHAMMEVKLPRPGPYQIRAAVRDAGSGDVGSAYSFVEVPDFNQPAIALSSIALSGPGGAARAGTDGQIGWGQFATGTEVHFDCEIFGVKTVRPPGEPKVEMEIRLFHNGEPVFDSQPLAVTEARLAEHILTGNMKIGGNMEPGDYTMQLVAFDRLASPKKQVAQQWVDLTVVKPGLSGDSR